MMQNWLLEAEPVDPMGENEIENTVVCTTAAALKDRDQYHANAMWDRMQEDAIQACSLHVGDKVRYCSTQPEMFQFVGMVTHIITAGCVRVQWRGGGRSSAETLVSRLEKVV